MTPKKGARETFPRVVWQTSHVGPRTLETDFVIVEVSLPRRGSNGRPQISPPAGGVTREIAFSPPPLLLLGDKACKNARPPLTNYANERSARDTRIFSLREGKDFRHSLFLFLFAREISTRIPSSEIQGFSRYCCPLFYVNPDYYAIASLLSTVFLEKMRVLLGNFQEGRLGRCLGAIEVGSKVGIGEILYNY